MKDFELQKGRGDANISQRQSGLYQSTGPATTLPTSQGYPTGSATSLPTSQGYPANQYAPYPPYPGPLSLPVGAEYGAGPYAPLQQEPSPVQATSPNPILVQLGASHNFLVNNRPARYIQVLDVDPSYQRARTPSPSRSPGKLNPANSPPSSFPTQKVSTYYVSPPCANSLLPALSIYVRAPETEVHYWAVFLRDLTVPELIKRVVQKYGFSDDERARVKTVVRVKDQQHEVRLLEDEDVKTMEPEIAIDVKVSSLDPQSEDWQLELRY